MPILSTTVALKLHSFYGLQCEIKSCMKVHVHVCHVMLCYAAQCSAMLGTNIQLYVCTHACMHARMQEHIITYHMISVSV